MMRPLPLAACLALVTALPFAAVAQDAAQPAAAPATTEAAPAAPAEGDAASVQGGAPAAMLTVEVKPEMSVRKTIFGEDEKAWLVGIRNTGAVRLVEHGFWGSAAAGAAQAASPESLAQSHNCMSCHSVDHKVVGPAFKSVAAKYRGKNAEGQLVQKVMKGGSGVWGSVPMPPNAGLSQADAHTLVKWVLSH